MVMQNTDLHSTYLLEEIRKEKLELSLMEVCGTHTMAIARSGLKELMPKGIRLISGPGCPVCVTAQADIDAVVALAREPLVILATFGDMMRVPGSESSLAQERSRGADIRVVYSPLDAVALARSNPGREVVFLGIGFETTAPAVAASIEMAATEDIKNYSVWSLNKLVPPALNVLFSDPELRVDGLICPGHVSTVIGISPYVELAARYKRPCVVTGFEPSDIIEGIYMILTQIKQGRSEAEIQYRRVVKPQGNVVAQKMIDRFFEPVTARWRGLGSIPASGLAIRKEYEAWDARVKFALPEFPERPTRGCSCGEILKGKITPLECPLFGRYCTPSTPIGPCMVSQEGACAAYYRYGRRVN